jgi:predicted dehydrogenase
VPPGRKQDHRSIVQPLRTAVIGVGHFGQHHAGKYAKLGGSRLVAVVDADPARAATVAARHDVEALSDYRRLLGHVDAVSIVTPPASHFAVASDFVEHGAHVLVEKPITESVSDAARLIALAAERGRVLQVGHIERFSAAGRELGRLVERPLFIQAQRLGPFKPRGEAVSAVLDLMIHDLDLILKLVDSPIEWAHAVGAPVVTGADDIASCRLQFESGCVADLTVSRVSLRSERKMRIFQKDSCTVVDFLKRRIAIFRHDAGAPAGASAVKIAETVYPQIDALEDEISAFLAAARGERLPVVTGEDGRRALEAALRVDSELRRHRQRFHQVASET